MIRSFVAAAAIAALFGAGATAAAAAAKSDKDFIKDAIKGDAGEVVLGKLAADKGGSADIRDFGSTLATDHGKAKDQATAVAEKLGVAAPDGIKDEAAAERDKLQGLSGDAFDQEFASYMVKDHEKDIAEYKTEADKGSGPASDYAKKNLPVLHKHLDIARSLSGKT